MKISLLTRFLLLIITVALTLNGAFATTKTAWLEDQQNWLDISQVSYDFANQKLNGTAIWQKEVLTPIHLVATGNGGNSYPNSYAIINGIKQTNYLGVNGVNSPTLGDFNLIVFNADGSILTTKTYDLAHNIIGGLGNHITLLNTYLSGLPTGTKIAIFTNGDPQLIVNNPALLTTLKSFGMSDTNITNLGGVNGKNSAYILIGAAGIGSNNNYYEKWSAGVLTSTKGFFNMIFTQNIPLDTNTFNYTKCKNSQVSCTPTFRFDGSGNIDSNFYRAFSNTVGWIDFSLNDILNEATISSIDISNLVAPLSAVSDPKVNIFTNQVSGFIYTNTGNRFDLSTTTNNNFLWHSISTGTNNLNYTSGILGTTGYLNTQFIFTYNTPTTNSCAGSYIIASPADSTWLTPYYNNDLKLKLAGQTISNPQSLQLYINGKLIKGLISGTDYQINTDGTWNFISPQPLLARGVNTIYLKDASSINCPLSNKIYIDTSRLSFTTTTTTAGTEYLYNYREISDLMPIYINFRGIDTSALTLHLTDFVTKKTWTKVITLEDFIWQNNQQEGFIILRNIFGGTTGTLAGAPTSGFYLLQITGTALDTGDLKSDEVFVNINPMIVNSMSVASLADQSFVVNIDQKLVQNINPSGKVIWKYIKFGIGNGNTISLWKVLDNYQKFTITANSDWRFIPVLPFTSSTNQKFYVCLYTDLGKNTCQSVYTPSSSPVTTGFNFDIAAKSYYFTGNKVKLSWSNADNKAICRATSSNKNFEGLRLANDSELVLTASPGNYTFNLECTSAGIINQKTISINVLANELPSIQSAWNKFGNLFTGATGIEAVKITNDLIVRGKMWSQNWGWLSFNIEDGAETIKLLPIANSGNNFDITGRAWLDSIGWIDFDSTTSTALYNANFQTIIGTASSDFGPVYFNETPPIGNTCPAGTHLDTNSGICYNNTISCTVNNGNGLSNWDSATGTWGACSAQYCNAGFVNIAGSCVNYCTYNETNLGCVLWQPNPAPVIDLYSAKSVVPAGTNTIINWKTNNTNSCIASGSWSGSKIKTGSFNTLGITNTSTYTLSCSGAGGSTQKSITVDTL